MDRLLQQTQNAFITMQLVVLVEEANTHSIERQVKLRERHFIKEYYVTYKRNASAKHTK